MVDEEKEWDGHDEVLKLINAKPELKDISKQLRKNEEKKIFEDILWSLIFYRIELQKHFADQSTAGTLDKHSMYQYCKEYIDSDFAHCPFLTNSILEQMIDVELLQIEHESDDTVFSAHTHSGATSLGTIITDPFNNIFSFAVSSLFLVFGLTAIYFLFSAGLILAAYATALILPWLFAGSIIRYFNSKRENKLHTGITVNLRKIREEISRHSFDPGTISGRIKNLEHEGLYISSLVYPLLNIEERK